MSKPPSERELQRVEAQLRKLKPGAQKAVGDGVYMRLDCSGRRRFQFRLRQRTGNHSGHTYDTWIEASQARDMCVEAASAPAGSAGASAAEIRN